MRSASSPPRDQIFAEAARADDFLIGHGLTVKTWWTLPNHRKSGISGDLQISPGSVCFAEQHGAEGFSGRLFGRSPGEKQAPWVILCDVSGSMQQYWDFYGELFAAVLASVQPAELFTFGTCIDSAYSQGIIDQSDVRAGTLVGEALRQWQQR